MKDENVRMIRNLRTSKNKYGNPRLFLEPVVLEAGNFEVGESISYTFVKQALIIKKADESEYKVAKRKRPSWDKYRPLIDYSNGDLAMLFGTREKIDILVSDSVIVIRKEQSFDLCVIGQPRLESEKPLKKLTFASFPSGAGIASAALEDTGFFESKMGADVWDPAIETYIHNFPKGSCYFGDVRSLNPGYIPSVDVAWLSPPCVSFSSLGTLSNGVIEGLGPHFARLIMATNAKALIIEQVPSYFSSRSFAQLKGILSPIFPYWNVRILDAFDYGSVASRKRGYAVALADKESFEFPTMPALPEHRRLTVGQVIGKEWEKGDWRPIKGTTMEHLLNKGGNNNFTVEKNRTLVGLDDKRISCIIANYSKINVTSSHLRHPDNPNFWRLFRSDELARFLDVPDYFSFPEFISENLRTKLLGQSVSSNIVKAIGIELAYTLMKQRVKKAIDNRFVIPMEENSNKQLAFIL
ncbi:DNA cytosine methyltransferase [Mesobacillus zeae]|uniref:DNA cytosine methyltransferase n=1 Tax=Mesobacillus zeae TaxID=1917180 RepID=UPI00300A9CB7